MAGSADGTRYPYLLVTQRPHRQALRPGQRLTPIALHPRTDVDSYQKLRRRVENRVRSLAGMWLCAECSGIEMLRAVSDPFIAGLLNDLWLTEVRLIGREDEVYQGEERTEWVVFGEGRLPEPWQGPADQVIPRETPVTVRSFTITPSAFRVEAVL